MSTSKPRLMACFAILRATGPWNERNRSWTLSSLRQWTLMSGVIEVRDVIDAFGVKRSSSYFRSTNLIDSLHLKYRGHFPNQQQIYAQKLFRKRSHLRLYFLGQFKSFQVGSVAVFILRHNVVDQTDLVSLKRRTLSNAQRQISGQVEANHNATSEPLLFASPTSQLSRSHVIVGHSTALRTLSRTAKHDISSCTISATTRQAIELERCSNNLRIPQDFQFRFFFSFGFGVLWVTSQMRVLLRIFGRVYLALGANPTSHFLTQVFLESRISSEPKFGRKFYPHKRWPRVYCTHGHNSPADWPRQLFKSSKAVLFNLQQGRSHSCFTKSFIRTTK